MRNLIRIVGSGGKGGSSDTYEADDNMYSRQSAAFVDAIAEGEIKGLVYGDASILIDEVRLRDVNQLTGHVSSAVNVNNFSVITAKGTADQTPDPEFFNEFPTASAMQEVGGSELLLNESQYFSISSGTFEKNNTDYVKVTISTSGMSSITKKGDSKGDVRTTDVKFDIDFRWIDNIGVSRTTNKFATGLTGKVSGNYAHTFGFNIEEHKAVNGMTDWSVRVTRVGGAIDTDTHEVQNAVYVNSIEASIADKLSYPYTAYVAGVIDAEQFSGVPQRGYEIDGKLISIPNNMAPIDYNGRKVTVASNVGLAVGDTLSQSVAVSSITSEGDADEGYVATGTIAAHGVPIGKTFLITIATTASQDEDFFEGEFTATSRSSTTFTYNLNKPYNETTAAFKTITSTTCTGTITGELWQRGEIDKINGTTIYIRDVPAESTVLVGQSIDNGVQTPTNVTAVEQVLIPANYRRDAENEKLGTAEYDWNGEFYTTWCNNPAWIFNDLIINKVYGLGNYLSQIQVNKWELYQIGRYCDELVPAGVEAADLLSLHTTNDAQYTGSTGEWEPRFSCNLVISGKQEAFKVLNDVASVFRGMIYWLNGEAYVVQDSEKDPVYQFTNANVINGEFKYEGTSLKTRTNQIIVGWNNPQDYYRSRQEIVELEEVLQKDDEFIKPDSITAFGCTSRGQARRLGKWKLLSNNLHTNEITFSSSLNAAFLRPGDIVQVIDQHKDGKSWGGRISHDQTGSGTTTIVRTDRQPTGFGATSVESGYAVGDYRLTCSFNQYKAFLMQDQATINIDGTDTALVRGDIITHYGSTAITTEELSKKIKDTSGVYVFTQWTSFHYTETRTLATVNGTGSLTVTPAFTIKPDADSIWVLSRAALETGKTKYEARLYRILQLSEQDNGVIEIQGLDYNAGKFDNVDKNEALTKDRTIYLPDSFKVVPPPINLSYSTRLTGDQLRTALTFDWDAPIDYNFVRHYEVYYSMDNIKWYKAGDTTSTDITKYDLTASTYYVRIFTVSLQSKRSAVAEATMVVDFQRAVGPSEGSVGNGEWTINQKGTISSSFGINAGTGAVTFTPDDYLHNDGLNAHTVTDQAVLAFANLSTSATNAANVGYVLFDHSANAFKAIAHDEASDQFYDVNSGSNVFAAAVGTITCSTDTGTAAAGTPRTIFGLDSGCDFNGELGLNNMFSFNDGSNTHYHRVKAFDVTIPDTKMQIHNPVNVTRTDANNQAFNKPRFIVDYVDDTIMGKVTRTGASSWILERFGISRGEGAYNINGTNEVHSFAGNAAGEVSAVDYAAYTNDYTITKDGQNYTYAASGDNPNTFGLALQAKTGFANNADVNFSGTGTITIDDNSLDSISSATATIRITDLSTGDKIADRIISFSKLTGGSSTAGTNAKTVRLVASDYSVVYDQDGETPNPSTSTDIVLTAHAQGFTNAYFKYEGDGFTDQTVYHDGSVDANKDVFDISGDWDVPTAIFSAPQTITVICQEGTSGGEIARDSITIIGVKSGTDSYTISQSNATHAVPADVLGANPVMTNSGTVFEVFKGGTQLIATVAAGVAAAGKFKVTAGTDTNITKSSTYGAVTNTNFITFADHTGSGGLTAATGEIEYAIDCENIQTVNVNQTFTRTDSGEAGSAAKTVLVSPSSHFIVHEDDFEPLGAGEFYIPTTLSILGITNNLTQNGVWSAIDPNGSTDRTSLLDNVDASPDSAGIVSCTIPGADVIDGMTIKYTLHADDGSGYDQTTIEVLESFSSAITPQLENEATQFITDSDGVSNPDYAGSGTDIKVYEGSALLDYDGIGTAKKKWKVVVGNATQGALTEGGITSIGSANTRYARIGVHAAAASDVDVFTIPFVITGKDRHGDAFSFTKYQTLTKARRGSPAVDISISSSAYIFNYDDSDDTVPSPTAVTITGVQQAQETNFVTGDLTATNSAVVSAFSYTAGSQTGSGVATWTVTPHADDAHYPFTCTLANDDLSKSLILTKTVGGDSVTVTSVAANTPSTGKTTVTFSDSSTMVIDDGTNGVDGDGIDVIYKNSATAITEAPGASSGAPSGWSFTASAPSAGEKTYISFGTRSNNTGNYTWSVPSAITAVESKTETIFKKGATTPSIVATAGTFASPLTGQTGWSLDMDTLANGEKLWASTRSFKSDGGTTANWTTPVNILSRVDGTDATALTITNVQANTPSTGRTTITFSDSTSFIIDNGTNGSDGDGVDVIYKNSTTAITEAPGASSGAPSGWSFTASAPSAGEKTYISFGVRSNNTGNYTWSVPSAITAVESKTETIFKKGASVSIVATAGTFANPLTGNSGWSLSQETLANGEKLWASTRSFKSDGASTANWTTPVNILYRVDGTDATALTITSVAANTPSTGRTTITFSDSTSFIIDNGTNGSDGDGVDVIYKNSATAITSAPGASSGAPSGWSFTASAPSAGERTYISFGVRSNNTGNYTWSVPSAITAVESKTETIFKKGASVTIDGDVGTFAAPLTGNTSWSLSQETLANGEKLWSSTKTFYSDNRSTTDWTTPVNILSRVDGTDATALTITNVQANTPSTGRTTITFSDSTSFIIDNGTNGTDGDGVDVIYKNSATAITSAPGASSGAPSGWSFTASAPSAGERQYVSFGVRSNNTGNYTWSIPNPVTAVDGDTGAGTVVVYLLYNAFTQPTKPTNGTDSTPGSWTTAVPTPAANWSIWWSVGTRPTGGTTWTFSEAQFYFGDTTHTIPGILNSAYDLNLGATTLEGVLNMVNGDFVNYNNGELTFAQTIAALDYTPLDVDDAASFTSSTSAPNDSTTPSTYPAGHTWLHTTPTPDVLYISDGTNWIPQNVTWGVDDFEWGDIYFSDGAPGAFISYDSGSTYTGFNTTGELSIDHPTLGIFAVNYEWGITLTSALIDNITSFTLTNDDVGNDAWTKSTFPTASTSVECTVTHTASGRTFTVGCNAQAVTFGSGGGLGGCFLPGTPVDLLNGETKAIEEMEIGDKVKGGTVLNKQSYQVDNWYHLDTLWETLNLTAGHPVWIEDKGWSCINPEEYYRECKEFGHNADLEPKRIEVGDKTTAGKIEFIERVEEKQEVWNITVDNEHTYYVNGILVHNGAKE